MKNEEIDWNFSKMIKIGSMPNRYSKMCDIPMQPIKNYQRKQYERIFLDEIYDGQLYISSSVSVISE